MSLSCTESELTQIARKRIKNDELPCVTPNKVWGGRGEGRTCALCGEPIEEFEIEYEVEERLQGKLQIFRFHMLCQSIWQLECIRQDIATPPGRLVL